MFFNNSNLIFLNHTKEDSAVVNYDDLTVQEIIPAIKSKVIPFSKHKKAKGEVYFDEGKIVSHIDEKQEILDVGDLKIKGEHNIDNVMAATAATLIYGVSPKHIRDAAISFKGLPHRLEFVEMRGGVSFYNDSKATNPDASLKALTAFDEPVILLLGGRNKGNSFVKLVEEAEAKEVKAVILFGETKEEIAPLFEGSLVSVKKASSVEEAVRLASGTAGEGDVVLFSPGSASFDMFANFEERGEAFKSAVLNEPA